MGTSAKFCRELRIKAKPEEQIHTFFKGAFKEYFGNFSWKHCGASFTATTFDLIFDMLSI